MARHVYPALIIAALMGCDSTGPRVPPPCLAPVFEFEPTDCAVLSGRLLGPAGILAGHGVLVDSVVPIIGLAYASAVSRTTPDGTILLTIYRVSRFTPPTEPDTASVEIQVFTNPDHAAPGRTPDARGFVRLLFKPTGAVADTTRVDVSVGISEGDGLLTRSCC